MKNHQNVPRQVTKMTYFEIMLQDCWLNKMGRFTAEKIENDMMGISRNRDFQVEGKFRYRDKIK